MVKKNVNEVLAMSNSAIGRWAKKKDRDEVPLHLRTVLGYCRYSSNGQQEETIEKQEEFITAHAKSKGMREPRFFKDRAVSGVTDDRAGWNEMVRHVRPGVTVMAHEITRLARETFSALKMIRQIQAAGGTIEFVNIDAKDTIYLTIMSAVAEYDYRSVVTRLRDGRVQAVAKGIPYRKPCFGYDKVGKDFVINEVEAQWVREIFRMRLEGATCGQIVRSLVNRKAPTRTGGLWSTTRVNQILYNPLYAGYLVQKRPVFAWEKDA